MKEHWLCRFLYWLKKKFVVDEKYGLDLSLDEYIELALEDALKYALENLV